MVWASIGIERHHLSMNTGRPTTRRYRVRLLPTMHLNSRTPLPTSGASLTPGRLSLYLPVHP